MSETAEIKAKESGLNAAVLRFPVLGWVIELVRKFGVTTVLLGFLVWRVDGWVSNMQDTNKSLTESALQRNTEFAKIVEQNTSQSRQTQQAIERFSEQSTSNQRSMERVLDRLERSSSTILKPNPRAPVIE